MRYVGEREVCYDPNELGFPSILGCHAIVYVAPSGLFGFHNYGGERAADWPELIKPWQKFVREHVQGGGAGKALYGVCFPESRRSYVGVKRATWLAELDAFGKAIGYTGPIWGYDLDNAGITTSAYVNFFHIQGKCVIQARPWVQHEDTKGVNDGPTNHKIIRRNDQVYDLLEAPRVATTIGMTFPKTYYPEKLR